MQQDLVSKKEKVKDMWENERPAYLTLCEERGWVAVGCHTGPSQVRSQAAPFMGLRLVEIQLWGSTRGPAEKRIAGRSWISSQVDEAGHLEG